MIQSVDADFVCNNGQNPTPRDLPDLPMSLLDFRLCHEDASQLAQPSWIQPRE